MFSSLKNRDTGYTLVELLVSMVLAVFVAGFIFSAYSALLRGNRLQSKRADMVRETVLARKTIDRALDSLDTISLFSPSRMLFTEKQNSNTHSLEYRDSALFKDGRELIKKVAAFSMELTRPDSNSGRLLVWECSLKGGGWLCGEAY